MDEKLKSGICGDTDCMLGLCNCGDRAVYRCNYNTLGRCDTETCAENA